MSELDKLIAAANAVCDDMYDLGFDGNERSYRHSFVDITTFADGADVVEELRGMLKQARHELAAMQAQIEEEDRQQIAADRTRRLADRLNPQLVRPDGSINAGVAWDMLCAASDRQTETK